MGAIEGLNRMLPFDLAELEDLFFAPEDSYLRMKTHFSSLVFFKHLLVWN
jgi:hypothetical protein